MSDDMKHPRKHGIDIGVVRAERSARDAAQQTVLMERQSERFKLPETPGYEKPWVPYTAGIMPWSTTVIPYMTIVNKNITPRLWQPAVYCTTTNNGTDHWVLSLQLGASLEAQIDLNGLVGGVWTLLTGVTTFTTQTWTPSSIYCYMSATKFGAVGLLYVIPYLYVV